MNEKSDEEKREQRIKQLLRQVEEDIKETQAKLLDPQCSPESKEKLKESLKVFEDAKKLFKTGRWYPGAPGQHWKIKNGKWIHFDAISPLEEPSSF
ncbi:MULTISPECIES: hypothetical protein [Prochlorococcus]|uniref:hypothetical protein n=1 Tax=Prochlorococcus TaxID=1218 RepID=UPI000533B63E|nr:MULTISPECIES: hypothetical protein [Prochlorococcus]KGG12706.1 hypothetical protein EV05_1924 [Prochlorococcus sp. MIT 0601]